MQFPRLQLSLSLAPFLDSGLFISTSVGPPVACLLSDEDVVRGQGVCRHVTLGSGGVHVTSTPHYGPVGDIIRATARDE